MISAIALDLGTTFIKACLLQDGALTGVIARASPGVQADGGRYESDALAYAVAAEAGLAGSLGQDAARPPARPPPGQWTSALTGGPLARSQIRNEER